MPEPLTALELASGVVTGGRSPLLAATSTAPSDALRAAVLPALQRPPCLVSFSGGIDSSLVLSAATQAARRHALPDPVPITWRFTAAPRAEESAWQEQIVSELGLADWVRLPASPGELDFVGPVATGVLRRHGVLYPANSFLHGPMLQRARGGTLLTGIGGDQVLGLWRWRTAAAVRRGDLPRLTPRCALAVAHARAPLQLRAWRQRRTEPLDTPWLRPGPRREVHDHYAREQASEPRTWPGRVSWQAGRRHLELGLHSLELLAADADAVVTHPLLDPQFLSALATHGGRYGVGNRLATIDALLPDVAPDAIRQRRTKAIFNEVFWQDPAQELTAGWNGAGVDPRMVDPEGLRAAWQAQQPDTRTAGLLQAIWLSANPANVSRAPR